VVDGLTRQLEGCDDTWLLQVFGYAKAKEGTYATLVLNLAKRYEDMNC
jgi:hypothetical protein